MDPASTYFQVLTEFINSPAPDKTTVTNNGICDDRNLSFGDMSMGVGHAFLIQGDTNTTGGIPVLKSWTNVENRSFLIEQVPYSLISNLLGSLHSSTIKPDKNKVRRTVMLDQVPVG